MKRDLTCFWGFQGYKKKNVNLIKVVCASKKYFRRQTTPDDFLKCFGYHKFAINTISKDNGHFPVTKCKKCRVLKYLNEFKIRKLKTVIKIKTKI